MVTIKTICDLQNYLFDKRKEGCSVGLVPTMGALHAGHGSLIKRASAENGVTVVSVFLNPTQFNDKEDLDRYPRTLEADCQLAEQMGADVVFAPSVREVYPEPDSRQFSFPPVTEVMEGAHRPGHFNGVCQVVSRLFYMSSRNTLLKPEERAIAPLIYKTLTEAVAFSNDHSVEETRQFAINKLNAVDGLSVEYFSIVDADSLLDINSWDDAPHVAGCITVYCGSTPIRLIDHIRFK